MRAICSRTLLLLCCIWATDAQAQNSSHHLTNGNSHTENRQLLPKVNVWDEPIRFNTKNKDSCTMVISGQGNFTRLRVSCKTKGKSYWCDFLGKPNHCRSYNNNPRHYFTQIMWDMRKLPNACQGRQIYKPQMCRAAADEVQMVFHNSWPKISFPKPTQSLQSSVSPTKPPSKPQHKPPKTPNNPRLKSGTRTSGTQRKTPKPFTARPTVPEESQATRMAEEYCWTGLHGFCRFFLRWFMN
ncbi:hypothetical protein DNTS_032483 [Danionella cerebrum]|uniref:Fibroblast growth factor-binding protein 2 n=1 Tax=Danionella cerebrum TaxID=2873325 RepID=A0A553QYZ1_9TELE|nr:hypothetical protein DNTS_032483 [Danionella translucida]